MSCVYISLEREVNVDPLPPFSGLLDPARSTPASPRHRGGAAAPLQHGRGPQVAAHQRLSSNVRNYIRSVQGNAPGNIEVMSRTT